MLKSFRIAWPPLIALAVTLAGCAHTMMANPDTFSVRGDTARLRAPQSITLKNGYSSETKMIVYQGAIWNVDMLQLTDAAIQMMSRHLAKNGIKVGAGEKTITLRVRDVKASFIAIPFADRVNTSLNLEARMGDGTASTVPAVNGSPLSAQRSIEGALLFAVTGLLNDAQFVGYVNH